MLPFSTFSSIMRHCSVLLALFALFAVALAAGMTVAIIIRMMYIRRRVFKFCGPSHAKVYTSAAAIFVESNALFTIFSIVCAVHQSHILGQRYFSVANYPIMQSAVRLTPLRMETCLISLHSDRVFLLGYLPSAWPSAEHGRIPPFHPP